jgi:SAM-dependent methyltransferase
MPVDTEQFRAMQRKVWSSGDWPDFAKLVQGISDELVEKADIQEGQDVLDIGTGSGNAALAAAARGAKVTGVDITPELFDAARVRAKEAGVEIEWIEADAAELPFPDQSFDRVLSTFGAIFAPQHQRAADELVRVTRPSGLFALATWPPDSRNGRFLRAVGEAMPPPPEGVQPPILWGDEDHVRELFEGKDVELEFDKGTLEFDWDSAEAYVQYVEENLGPAVMAKAVLEPEGKWDDLRAKLVEFSNECTAENGDFHFSSDYMRVLGKIPE